MEKVDRRIRRTQRLLADAFMELILEKSYDQITLKDITDKADVAYATFFRHYHDKDDFFTRVMEDEISELKTRMKAIPKDSSPDHAECAAMFEHVRERADLYRVLATDPATGRVRDRIKGWHVDMITEYKDQFYAPDSRIPFEIAANHMAASWMELIAWWLNNDMPYSSQRMGEIFRDLVMDGTWQIVNESTGPQVESPVP